MSSDARPSYCQKHGVFLGGECPTCRILNSHAVAPAPTDAPDEALREKARKFTNFWLTHRRSIGDEISIETRAYDNLINRIAAFASEQRRAATIAEREANCKAMCKGCATGLSSYGYIIDGKDGFKHEAKGGDITPCTASPIRSAQPQAPHTGDGVTATGLYDAIGRAVERRIGERREQTGTVWGRADTTTEPVRTGLADRRSAEKQEG